MRHKVHSKAGKRLDSRRFFQSGCASVIAVSIIAYACQMVLHDSDFGFFVATFLGISLLSFSLYRLVSSSDYFWRRFIWFMALQVAILVLVMFVHGEIGYLALMISPLALFAIVLLPGLCQMEGLWRKALFVFVFLVLTFLTICLLINVIDLEKTLHLILANTHDLEFILGYFIYGMLLLVYVWMWNIHEMRGL